jgi:hypothetical protein
MPAKSEDIDNKAKPSFLKDILYGPFLILFLGLIFGFLMLIGLSALNNIPSCSIQYISTIQKLSPSQIKFNSLIVTLLWIIFLFVVPILSYRYIFNKDRGKTLWLFALLVFEAVMIGSFGAACPNPNITRCIPLSGYYCWNATYSASSGNVLLDVEQDSGTNWLTANIFFVPDGIPSTIPPNGVVNAYGYSTGGLANGKPAQIKLGVSEPGIATGTLTGGSIWAVETNSSGNQYFVQIALIELRAT